MATRKAIALVSGLFQEVNTPTDKLDLAGNSTTDLAEGTNQYFTQPRARQSISVTDSGGDGQLAYDNTTGVITYTGPSATEVRSHFIAANSGTGFGSLSYDNSTGAFTFGVVTASNIRQQISVTDAGGDGSLSYDNTTGVITYNGPTGADARNYLSVAAGSGLTYNSTTGEFGTSSIPNTQLANSSITFGSTSASLGSTVSALSITSYTASSYVNIGGGLDTANSLTLQPGAIVFEGSTADAAETTLQVVNPTTDQTISFPDASGTVALLTSLSATAGSGLTYNNTTGEFGTSAIPNSQLANSSITIGSTAIALGGSSSTLGGLTITSGTWQGSIIGPTYGGTGVNNGSSTITLGGNFTTSGAFATTLTATGTTNVTLPTSGTLVNTAVTALSSLATVGTITSGTWQGSIIGPTYGGTGVNNGSSTITLGGNFTTSGAFATTLTTTGITNVTLPTSGTLVNTAVTALSSLATVGTIGTGTWQGSIIGPTYGGTGVNNGSRTVTLGGNFTTSGAFATTLTVTGTTNVTLPTSGTLVNTAVTALSSLATVGTITSGTWQGSTIGVAYGGTGQTSYTNGQLLIGNTTGNTLTKATLTAGTGISITNGSGSITIAATSGADVTAAGNNAFTGANTFTNATGQTFRQASTQDGVLLRGRAGGTGSFNVELVPTTLTASRTLTLPNVSDTVAVLGTAQTFTAVQTLTDPAIIGTILEDIFTITDGIAFEVDPGNGSVQLITLGANRTPKATNFLAGESVTLMVDDGTAYTLTWSDTTWGASGVTWVGGLAPTLATSGYTVIQFWKVGTKVYGARVGDVA